MTDGDPSLLDLVEAAVAVGSLPRAQDAGVAAAGRPSAAGDVEATSRASVPRRVIRPED